MFRKVHPRLISTENAEEKKIRQAFKMEIDLQKLRIEKYQERFQRCIQNQMEHFAMKVNSF